MSVQLPTRDEYTTYDYIVGGERMDLAHEGKMSFMQLTSLDCPGMPFIINSGDQFEYMSTHPTTVSSKLWVSADGKWSREINLIPKDRTLAFAQRSINQWGKEYAEKVLSATKTGALYWNVIYHFQTYKNLLEELHQSESLHPKDAVSHGEKRKGEEE